VTRILPLPLVVLLLLLCAACRDVFLRGAIETSTIQGAVSIVQLGDTLNGTGETIQVTFVTFLQNGVPFTIGFCGNQTTLFPPRHTVHVNFNPGRTCATVIVVVIVV
jgi:hypothetical protein